VPFPHLVFDASGYAVGEIVEIVIVHFPGEADQALHQISHFGDFHVATAAAFAVGAFVGALAGAGAEFHRLLPLVMEPPQSNRLIAGRPVALI